MPPARKSSIGLGRRGPPKAHIPFNADDLGHGKKTGLPIGHLERKSDDFEPFEQLMSQADQRTPPRVKKRPKKKSVAVIEEQDEDFDGEMSMEMDTDTPRGPNAYFTNARRLETPNYASTSYHSAPRSSDVDFDRVPSPRPRKSVASSKAGPSHLSQSTIAPKPDDFDDNLGGMDDRDFDDYNPPEHESPQASVRRKSFANLSLENEEEEEEAAAAQRSKSKGKSREEQRKAPVPDDMEEEITQGLQDLDDEPSEENEQEAPPPEKKPKKPREKRKRVELPPHEGSDNGDGVRRGKRHRYKPLEWWRQEKVVYGRRESGVAFVPHIKEIVRIPKEPTLPLRSKNKRRRGRSKTVEVGASNPEEGWDDTTDPYGIVLDYDTKQEVRRRLALPAKRVDLNPAANNDWLFQKVFGDGDFIAAGQLVIPPKSRKPSKASKDNTYVFYVIEGAVNLKVHNTSLILATGGMFLVPRGNTYYIENISDRDAKLFFTQARKVPAYIDGEEDESQPRRSASADGRKSKSRAPSSKA